MEDPIVYRGVVKLSRLKELALAHNACTPARAEESDFNPHSNREAISIIRQEDGNWKGYANKYGSVIVVRDVDPSIVLLRILTHS